MYALSVRVFRFSFSDAIKNYRKYFLRTTHTYTRQNELKRKSEENEKNSKTLSFDYTHATQFFSSSFSLVLCIGGGVGFKMNGFFSKLQESES